ncbi:MAG: putative Ca2+-binding hemolysin [Rhizobium sp.]|nr:putative Ca2+-binding hemolysin [Rhizobium sp.]
MAIINFSDLNNGDKINLGADKLVFDGGIDAADVAIGSTRAGLVLSVGGTSITLKVWVIGNLHGDQVAFGNSSELLVGDAQFTLNNDNNANLLSSFFLGNDNHDQILGLGGDDDMSGGEGNDKIYGNAGRDILKGDGDDDVLDGGTMNDQIFGGLGNDTIKITGANTGNDRVKGGEGNDEIFYSGASREWKQRIDGEAGNDVVHGGKGDDRLWGGADNDTVTGFGGDDLIIGGLGADLLDGKQGKDTYRITAADSPSIVGEFDNVLHFYTGKDIFDLDLVGTSINYIEQALSTDDFGAAAAKAVELFITNEGLKDYVFIAGLTRGWLFGEFTGDNTPDLAIEIGNGVGLDRLDFNDII